VGRGARRSERVVSLEAFTVSHPIQPRRGPSIAWVAAHEYALVKLIDDDGVTGWGESYFVPGILESLRDLAPIVLGRQAWDRLRLLAELRWTGADAYTRSALAIALEDLRARQLGVSVATLYGGPVRERVQLYAASGGYIEGEDPEVTWPTEADAVVEAGFRAMKLRIGRYAIPREKALLERMRRDLPSRLDLAADGNAGFTFPEAMRMGGILRDLGFLWFEEPLDQWGGYVGYERLAAALPIALSGGEVLMSRAAATEFLARRAVDIVQPEPVIIGGVGEALFVGSLARIHGIATMPHTSNSAIGIAAGLQVLALTPDPTASPASRAPMLEFGVDDNPWRDRLTGGFVRSDGWMTIPTGPGLGVEVDEPFVRGHAVATVMRREGE
jgi:D-galactarolactone cycloisomerase